VSSQRLSEQAREASSGRTVDGKEPLRGVRLELLARELVGILVEVVVALLQGSSDI